MSEYKIHNMRLRSGEQIEIRQAVDGKFYCPVCGFLLPGGEPPYFALTMEGGVDDFAHASFDICPCCHTEFGFDDYIDGKSRLQRWNELRLEWLNRIGWTSEALKQLQDNLDIDTDGLKRPAGR